MILDCSSFKSTKTSLINIFNTTEHELTLTLKSLNPSDLGYLPPEKIIFSEICSVFGLPDETLDILWFHGTRVFDIDKFRELGVLPKTQAKAYVESLLKCLSTGIVLSGENPFVMSMSGKDGPHDEGPFAFLIKDIAINAPRPNHNYTKTPEMVEDIAGSWFGENYSELVERFKEKTEPSIISFYAKAKGHELSAALFYMKLILDGESEIDAGSSANIFFDSEGEIITPDRIKDIELLKSV